MRDERFKLYRNGRFFNVPEDLNEETNLLGGQAGERGETARKKLGRVLGAAPPAPPLEGGKGAEKRPIHPDWKNLVDPND